MTSTKTPPPTKRIEYIDALRGFTMILVVLSHVATFCLDLEDVPKNHSYLKPVFRDHPMPALELFFSFTIALIVIALCLLVSNVFRLSPTLAYWLFDVKKNTEKTFLKS